MLLSIFYMFDSYIRTIIDPPLNTTGKYLSRVKISANSITIAGFLFGLISIMLISFSMYYYAIVFILLNRLCDGLDGAVARNTSLTDFGGFLDILCDFIIYSGVIFAFSISDNEKSFAASFLIFSFIGPITSFLSYAIIAEKRKIKTSRQGKKSFYYLSGICEGTETAIILIALCVFHKYFDYICFFYGFLCWLTTIGRAYSAWINFK